MEAADAAAAAAGSSHLQEAAAIGTRGWFRGPTGHYHGPARGTPSHTGLFVGIRQTLIQPAFKEFIFLPAATTGQAWCMQTLCLTRSGSAPCTCCNAKPGCKQAKGTRCSNPRTRRHAPPEPQVCGQVGVPRRQAQLWGRRRVGPAAAQLVRQLQAREGERKGAPQEQDMAHARPGQGGSTGPQSGKVQADCR